MLIGIYSLIQIEFKHIQQLKSFTQNMLSNIMIYQKNHFRQENFNVSIRYFTIKIKNQSSTNSNAQQFNDFPSKQRWCTHGTLQKLSSFLQQEIKKKYQSLSKKAKSLSTHSVNQLDSEMCCFNLMVGEKHSMISIKTICIQQKMYLRSETNANICIMQSSRCSVITILLYC